MKKRNLGVFLMCAMLMGSMSVVAFAAAPAKDQVSGVPVGSGVGVTMEETPNNGEMPLSAESIPVDVDSAPLDEMGRATLHWNDEVIRYDTRKRFISSYDGGYFTLDGVTATFEVELTNGESENIEIDWCDSKGNVTVLYTGTTSGTTVSYTARGREKGNFRVWNKAVDSITVDASISY